MKGLIVWLFGLSGAGKTTISLLLQDKLHSRGLQTILLDGDQLRAGLNKDLTFSDADRLENVRRVAEIAKLVTQSNIVTICSCITPMEEYRVLARDIIGKGKLLEVFVDCPLHICEQRDVKGLYKRARENSIENFTGISAPFERPDDCDLIIRTDQYSPLECVEHILELIDDGNKAIKSTSTYKTRVQ